jgi:hypothetical protein
MPQESSTGFVVTRPYDTSNVGSNLSSLAGALWVARQTSRSLVVDWRGLTQLQDKTLNYFTEFFEHPAEIDGVQTLYAPAVDGFEDAPTLEPTNTRLFAIGERDVDAPAVKLVTYHGLDRIHPGPETERVRLLRSFYRSIRPAPKVAAAMDPWWADNCTAPFVVGINVRTGNGQYFGKGMPYASRVAVDIFENRSRFLRVIERACRARTRNLPKDLRDSYQIFYATDSAWMSELLGRLPDAVTRRSVFPPAGAGDTFTFTGERYSDQDSVSDTLADMFLLARCDALVYNSSIFNQYARVTTGWFGGNRVHIESLFLGKRLARARTAVRRRLR